MAFTLDIAKALVKDLEQGGLERTLTTKDLVDALAARGLKVLGVYGARARLEKRDGIICLPVDGRLVEVEPVGGKWYTPYAERINEPFVDY